MRCICRLLSWSFLFLVAFAPRAAAQQRPRYEALFADGSRVEGQALHEWHRTEAQPRLDDRPLWNPQNPLVWLRDRSRPPPEAPEAFVETICGDRLPGEALMHRAAGSYDARTLPAHFVVQPAEQLGLHDDPRGPEVRVLERFVRRIVWRRQRGAADRYEPNTLLYVDGRAARFRSARFDGASVRLLADDGPRRVGFSEIAELHLPRQDPWQGYCDELATLDPTAQSRLVQIETTGGLRVTGALCRFAAREDGRGHGPEHWLHGLQPAWSPGVLWIPQRRVAVYRSFAPHQPPLTRVPPDRVVQRGMLGGSSWPWQLDRNVQGGPLRCGGQAGGWGLGTHATAELHFPLPAAARAFRTRLGLDEAAGSGGCVRARVFAGSPQQPPLYETPHLIGSAKPLDTGPLSLGPPGRTATTLVLQVDAAHEGRPAGADPLDVRDVFNWLEPTLELDPAALLAEVQKRQATQVFAWEGWQSEAGRDGGLRLTTVYDESGPERGVFLTAAAAERAPFTLRRTLQIEPQHHWLLIGANVRADYSNRIKLQLRLAGELMAEQIVPVGNAQQPQCFALPLEHFQGHRLGIEMAQLPGDERLSVWWRELALADQLPVAFRALDDEAPPAALQPEGKAEIADQDAYTGKRCVKLLPGGRLHLDFQPPLRVRGTPAWGDYRLLRLAARKFGQGRFSVELEHENSAEQPWIFDAGKGPPCHPKAKRIFNDEFPGEWQTFTRDLVGDFGERDITGLTVSVDDGQYLLLDHIYFVRWHDDLRWLPAETPGHLLKTETRQQAVERVRQLGLPAAALIEVERRRATGMLVGNEGHLITAAHVLGKPGLKAAVTLADGRTIEGTTGGMDRASDLGLVKLPANVPVPQPGLREWIEGQERNVFVTVFHAAEGGAAQSGLPPIWRAFDGSIWTGEERGDRLPGAALLNWDGAVVGVQTRRSRFGGTLYSKTLPAQQQWDRLKRGEIWGEWLRGAGPTLGAALTSTAEGCRVGEPLPGAAAGELKPGDLIAKLDGQPVDRPSEVDRLIATKDPGDEVTLELVRAGQRQQIKLQLQHR